MGASTETEQTIVYDIKTQNQKIINDYFEARKTETNLAASTQIVINNTLNRLSRFANKNFKDVTRDEKISYCKECVKYGFLGRLKNRIYPDNEPIPVDHENWLQCHECGTIVPVYEIEKEASIKDVVETVDNPFDIGKSILGIDSRTSIGARMQERKEKGKRH